LPSGTSFQGQSNVAVWNAQLKLWGVLGANDTTTDDGSATFATDINSNLLVGVALHELTHAMGRVPYGPPYGPQPDIFDLFRFTSAGTRLISGTSTAPTAYFSVDNGVTKLADYGRTSDSSDFLNSGVQGSSDAFNEFYGGGTIQALSAVDKLQLAALGFHTAAPALPDLRAAFDHLSTSTIAAGGSTSVDFWNVNFGSGSAAASTTGFYLSTDATLTTADSLLMTFASPALTANATAGYYDHQTVSLALPGNLAPGTYYIGGIADYTNAIAESNETNNTYNVTQITVTAGLPTGVANGSMSVNQTPTGAGNGDNFVFNGTFATPMTANEPSALDHNQFDHAIAASVPDTGHGYAADVIDALHHPHDFFLV
jgi:hypothetical protein